MGRRRGKDGKREPTVRQLGRMRRNLRDILAAAKPHWKPVVAAFLIMAVQAAFDTGRLLLVLPIIDRVLDLGGADLPAEELGNEGEMVNTAVEGLRSQDVAGEINAIVVWMNGYTQSLVPESVLEGTETRTLPGRQPRAPPATPEEGLARREKWRDRYASLISVLILFVLMLVVMCAATYGESYISVMAQLRILMDVREAIARRVMQQRLAFFDQQKQGELVQRVLGDVGGYATGLSLVFSMGRTFFKLVVPITILAAMAPKMMLSLLIVAPFFLPMKQLLRRILKRSHKRQEQGSRLNQVLLQMFSGIRIVKAFGAEERRTKEFRQTDEELTRLSLKVQRAKSTAATLITFMNNLLSIVLIVGGSALLITGVLDVHPAVMVAFAFLLANMYQPVKRFVKQLNELLDSMASIERTTEYLAMPDGTEDQPGAVDFGGIEKEVRFDGVHFAYEPGRPVLQDISFVIPKGGTVALVGPSGGGKSTICDLMLRFRDPDQGKVLIDGRDAQTFKRKSYLQRVGVVTQSPFLFHTSIADNIRQGKPEATQEEIESAARSAYIHDDIVKMPLGYDEVVGETGVRLSGGQRQRITIARALLRNPDLLVLDEATASLDTASEKAVQAALDELRAGRTTLVVAHRLSTIRGADEILVIDEGRIAERGTHENLIAKDGIYARLVEMQDLSPSELPRDLPRPPAEPS